MFDVILKSKFYTKCKAEAKMTKKRIEMIKRKRNAMERFLRNDVADLLRNHLHSNAYSRVEQLYADQNLSSCYDVVDQSCSHVLSHLSAMSKQRECPEECREAISTLMFAAARFADLPELRQLRSLFVERYGNFLEPYVNVEFVKYLKADPPAKEIKLQMMQDIATECGIVWSSKSLEQKLWSEYANGKNNESVRPQHQIRVETEKKKPEILKYPNVGNGLPYISRAEVVKKEEKQKDLNAGNGLPYQPRAVIEKKDEKYEDLNVGNGLPYKPRVEVEKRKGCASPYWSSNTSTSSDVTTSPEYSTGPDDGPFDDTPKGRKFNEFGSTESPYGKTESTRKSTSSNTASSSGRGEEVTRLKFKDDKLQSEIPDGRKFKAFGSMAPPPYVKTESTKKSTSLETASSSGREKEAAKSTFKDNNLQSEIPEGRKLYGFRSMAPPYIKTDLTKKITSSDEKVHEEETENISKPVPRSMRNRRPLKPMAGSTCGNNEIPKPSPKFSTGENRGLEHRVDEEEMKTDKLLSHYSRKQTHIPSAPMRSGSLPTESVATPVPMDERKGLARAVSYHPESDLSPQGGHVHPKLPDYDDFVARLAEHRARS